MDASSLSLLTSSVPQLSSADAANPDLQVYGGGSSSSTVQQLSQQVFTSTESEADSHLQDLPAGTNILEAFPSDIIGLIANFVANDTLFATDRVYEQGKKSTAIRETASEIRAKPENLKKLLLPLPEERREFIQKANDKAAIAFDPNIPFQNLNQGKALVETPTSTPIYAAPLSDKDAWIPSVYSYNLPEVVRHKKNNTISIGLFSWSLKAEIHVPGGEIKDFCVVPGRKLFVATTYSLRVYDISNLKNIKEDHSFDIQLERLAWDDKNRTLYGQKIDKTHVAYEFMTAKAMPLPKATGTSHLASKVGFTALGILRAIFVVGLKDALQTAQTVSVEFILPQALVYTTLATLSIGIGGLIMLVAAVALPAITALGIWFVAMGLGCLMGMALMSTLTLLVAPPLMGGVGAYDSFKENVWNTNVFG